MALLFNGRDGAHEYFLDGPEVPSTTRILRDSGLVRLDNVPPFILERARQRGSAVHQLVHYLNENDLDWASVDPAYRGYLDGWLRCRDEKHLTVLLCEHRVASRRHRTAGTIDLLCEIEDEGWLYDYATGDPEDVAKYFQTASYLGMAMEWATEDARLAQVLSRHRRWRRGAVRLMKNGTFRFTEYTDARDYARFNVLAAAWHIRKQYGALVEPDDLAA